MHLSVQFNHFSCAHWVAVRCEASGASEATPAVAEASEASGSYLYIIMVQVILQMCLEIAMGNSLGQLE